jgi:S1-C subfamily serine protease
MATIPDYSESYYPHGNRPRNPLPPYDPDRNSRRPGRAVYFWPWIFVLLFLGLIVWKFWPHQGNGNDPNALPRPVTPRGDLTNEEKTTIQIFRQASPAVVHVTTLALERNQFNLDVQQVPQGTGSGFVWDQKGHIVTNYHVIRSFAEGESDSAQVTLADHSSWPVKWYRAYPDEDLALLWIEAPAQRLHPILVGSSHDLQVGQTVFAIGNPFGLDHSLTKGIISALDRQISSVTSNSIKGVIQTDAAINPGNSGGPLLDSAGRLIGVNAAILSPSKASAGIGFAIPVDEVNRIIPQLISHGKVVHPDLGVQLADDELLDRLHFQAALILNVTSGSSASKAGLRPARRDAQGTIRGDLIEAIDGKSVRSKDDYYTILNRYKVGDRVKLKVRRGVNLQEPQDGQGQTLEVTLGAAE